MVSSEVKIDNHNQKTKKPSNPKTKQNLHSLDSYPKGSLYLYKCILNKIL